MGKKSWKDGITVEDEHRDDGLESRGKKEETGKVQEFHARA